MIRRKDIRKALRSEPSRNVVAYIVPRPGFASVATGTARKVRVADGARELAESLESLGCKVARFASVGDADAWLDDEKRMCRECNGGTGKHVCDDCQQQSLVAELTASVARTA